MWSPWQSGLLGYALVAPFWNDVLAFRVNDDRLLLKISLARFTTCPIWEFSRWLVVLVLVFCGEAVNNKFMAKIIRFEICSRLFIHLKKALSKAVHWKKLIYNYLPVFLFPLHLQIYWYSTAYTPPTLVSPRNELLTGSNPFSWSWVKLWKSCDRVRQQNRPG